MKTIGVPAITRAKQPESEKKINGFDQWTVRDAMRTLEEAHRIQKDVELMKAVGELAKEKMAAMAHMASHAEEITGKK